ncbi:MAG: hypothetical protein K0S20_316 [Patescibacteria group bacterium]|nr:hypothetical protein [Patescibacteria group bacterium]
MCGYEEGLALIEEVGLLHGRLGLAEDLECKIVHHSKPDDSFGGVVVLPFLNDLASAIGIKDPYGSGYEQVCNLVWNAYSQAMGINLDRSAYTCDFPFYSGLGSLLEACESSAPFEKGEMRYHLAHFKQEYLTAEDLLARRGAAGVQCFPLGIAQNLCIALSCPAPIMRMIHVGTSIACLSNVISKRDTTFPVLGGTRLNIFVPNPYLPDMVFCSLSVCLETE